MHVVGIKPGEVYTSDDRAQGKGYQVGTRGVDSNGKEYIYCVVAASQNLVNGNLVSLLPGGGTAAFTATIYATGGPAPGPGTPLGVITTSVTASASNYVWVQVFGSCNVSITDATASNLPNHLVVPASVSGAVRGAIATASSFIEGLTFSATASTGSTGAMFLSYPRIAPA
jgi:hypothetical protein